MEVSGRLNDPALCMQNASALQNRSECGNEENPMHLSEIEPRFLSQQGRTLIEGV